ncbi:RDD domain-containing protein [Natrialba asiatica DSM 12278]|uniref:RDD domain-containing protein n=1 Tax=Natrialba asiatica (strain ATCC 700177 / DSM 12278 / JCM 9576 / FERM P-10747 / NBRC 102637 / 172P1) TaxID=29540 RepID=M0AMZ3_NATA1|nr:RDD domain-containing protein [Natrialba asiatica DSM 12278]
MDRALAAGIDLGLCYVLLVAPISYVVLSVLPVLEAQGPVAVAISLGILVPVNLTYAFVFEWRYSRTPGKVARSLMVTTAEGEPCTLRASAVRNLLRYVDGLGVPPLLYAVGVLASAVSPSGQRVGDRLADTVVVRSGRLRRPAGDRTGEAARDDTPRRTAETGETAEGNHERENETSQACQATCRELHSDLSARPDASRFRTTDRGGAGGTTLGSSEAARRGPTAGRRPRPRSARVRDRKG